MLPPYEDLPELPNAMDTSFGSVLTNGFDKPNVGGVVVLVGGLVIGGGAAVLVVDCIGAGAVKGLTVLIGNTKLDQSTTRY